MTSARSARRRASRWPSGTFEVDGHAQLVAVHLLVDELLRRREVQREGTGPLEPDHTRAQIAQDARGGGAGPPQGHVDHDDAGEGQRRAGPICRADAGDTPIALGGAGAAAAGSVGAGRLGPHLGAHRVAGRQPRTAVDGDGSQEATMDDLRVPEDVGRGALPRRRDVAALEPCRGVVDGRLGDPRQHHRVDDVLVGLAVGAGADAIVGGEVGPVDGDHEPVPLLVGHDAEEQLAVGARVRDVRVRARAHVVPGAAHDLTGGHP